jgi:hypothetical protein
MFPKARTNKVIVEELIDETLVYDQQRHKAHCLNRTSAWVWKHCDGVTSEVELARRLADELQVEEPEAVVQLALEQLTNRQLLENAAESLGGPGRLARRDVLKKLAVAAGTLPMIMTVMAPHAQAQGSKPKPKPDPKPEPECENDGDCGGTTCQPVSCDSGNCVDDPPESPGLRCTGCPNDPCCACDGAGNCIDAICP